MSGCQPLLGICRALLGFCGSLSGVFGSLVGVCGSLLSACAALLDVRGSFGLGGGIRAVAAFAVCVRAIHMFVRQRERERDNYTEEWV